jgi:hypothetical protein
MRKTATAAIVSLSILAGASGSASAESQQIELGSVDLAVCTFTAYLDLEAPDINSIIADAQNCAEQATGAATLSWIIASPAAALPTFTASFSACMSGQDWSSVSLSVEPDCGD